MSLRSLVLGAVFATWSIRSALGATSATTTTTTLGEEWTVKPWCAMEHMRYIDEHDQHFDLETNNSVICQERCFANVTCAYFTFYPDRKACWQQTAGSTLNNTVPGVDAIAGPKACPSTSTTTTTEEAGGFPWWGWLLIALGVLCCLLALGLAYYLMNSQKSNRKPKKKKRAIREEAPLMPVAAPMAAPVPVQYYAPVQTYQPSPVYVTSATPVTYAAPAPTSFTYTAPAPTTVTYATGAPMPAGGSFVMAPPGP